MGPSHPPFSQEYLSANIGGRLIAVSITFIPIIVSVLALRCFSRRYLRNTPWGIDDILAVISGIILIAWSIIGICLVKFAGVGRHLPALEVQDPQLVTEYFKWLLVISVFYYTTVVVPKLAILALYGRLLTVNPYRAIIWILAAILVVSAVVIGVMCLNLCHPFQYNWDHSIPGHCLDQQAFYTYASLPNIVTDVALLILPLPVIWKLHTSTKVKIGLIATFLTGSLGLVTSILRFIIFTRGNAVKDGTWSCTELMIWSIIEPNVYLISACLPTMRPILAQVFGHSESSDYEYDTGYRNKSGSLPNANSNPAAQNRAFDPRFDPGLYGDEVHLVSVAVKGSDTSMEQSLNDQIHVQREVGVSSNVLHRE